MKKFCVVFSVEREIGKVGASTASLFVGVHVVVMVVVGEEGGDEIISMWFSVAGGDNEIIWKTYKRFALKWHNKRSYNQTTVSKK